MHNELVGETESYLGIQGMTQKKERTSVLLALVIEERMKGQD